MSQPIVINIGALPNDGTGDPLRTAFNDVNLNFANVFASGPVGSNIQIVNNIVSTLNTNGNLVLSPNGIGVVQANSHVVPNQTRLRNLGSANLLWNVTYTQYLNTTYATIGTANIGNIGTFNIDVANLHISGGTNGYVLQTDGTGNLTWTAQTGGSGNGTPGGANTQIQYNDAGAFGATAGFTFDNVSNILTVPGNVSAGNVLTSAQVIANGEIQSGTGFFTGGYLSVNGDTDLHNANITGNLSVTGNVSADAFIGDGSQLTNLPLATNFTVGVMALGNGFTLNGSNQVTTSSLYNTNLTQPTQHYALSVDTNGVVILPDQSIINGSTLRAVAGSYAGLTTNDGENSWMWVDSTGAYIATQYNESGNSHQWTFDNTGNLTLPGNSEISINYANGSPYGGSGGVNTGNIIFALSSISTNAANTGIDIFANGSGYVNISSGNGGYSQLENNSGNGNVSFVWVESGNAYVAAGGDKEWIFDNTGSLNLPNSGQNPHIQSANVYPTIIAYGSNGDGGPELDWANGDDVNDSFGNSSVLRNTMYLNDGGLYIGINENGVANVPTPNWQFRPDGTLTFPDNSGSSWPVNTQRFGMGNIGAWLDGQWTIGEFSGNGVSGEFGIRIDPAIEGPVGMTFPSSASSNTQPVQIYSTNGSGISLYTGGNNWAFNANGTTTFPTLTVDLHNGGVQSGQVLQFGDGNQQAIITGPAPLVEGYNAQRLIIQGQNGNTGEGGDVYVWGGDSQFNGGDIKIYAGDADNGASGVGGNIHISGGVGQNPGGEISLTGGTTYNGQGAPVVVTGGRGSTTGGAVNLNGGYGDINGGTITLTAGYGGTNAGGNVDIISGISANGLAYYGNVNINAGASSWHFDNTGELYLSTGGRIGATKGGTMLDGGSGNSVSLTSFYGNGYYAGCFTANPDGNVSITTYTGNGVAGTWSFDNGANLVLAPTNQELNGAGSGESAKLRGTRKIVNGYTNTYAYSTVLAAGGTPTVAYTATDNSVMSAKVTFAVEGANGVWEQFDVSAVIDNTGNNVNFTVSNRVKRDTAIPDTVVTAAVDGSDRITISLNLDASQPGGGWSSFDAVEFGLMVG